MERLTEKTIGVFHYRLKNAPNKNAFFAYSQAVKRLGQWEDANEPKPIDQWHEDDVDCLWWSFLIEEAPYCGTPLDEGFPEYATHFTRLMEPLEVK